jgi:hypothetical protein
MKKRRPVPFRISQQTLLLALILVGSGAGLFTYSVWTGQQENTKNTGVTVYPAQYSDEHITDAAKVADPRFKEVAFAKEPGGFLANVFDAFKKPKVPAGTSTPEHGTWLWTPILQITPAYRDSIIAGAKKNGIQNIYLSIDSYLDIYTLPDGEEKEAKKKAFTQILEGFIAQAHKEGLTVDAEAGWRNWAEPGHEYKPYAVLEYAIIYNKTHAEKLRGFQYDIEPYLLLAYKNDKKTVLRNFVTLIQETVLMLEQSDLALSVTIPEFYDGAHGETPRYFYGLRYSYTINHLLNTLEDRPGSKIIVMAYRNTALGKDGAIDISQTELNTADRYQTKIIVAQETGDVLPPYITFYTTSKSQYKTQLEIIQSTLKNQKSYGGVATHYINALLSLK